MGKGRSEEGGGVSGKEGESAKVESVKEGSVKEEVKSLSEKGAEVASEGATAEGGPLVLLPAEKWQAWWQAVATPMAKKEHRTVCPGSGERGREGEGAGGGEEGQWHGDPAQGLRA